MPLIEDALGHGPTLTDQLRFVLGTVESNWDAHYFYECSWKCSYHITLIIYAKFYPKIFVLCYRQSTVGDNRRGAEDPGRSEQPQRKLRLHGDK